MREQTDISIMPILVRASVDDEKFNTKRRTAELRMSKAELIHAGLKKKKMSVRIVVERHVGAPVCNQNKKKK